MQVGGAYRCEQLPAQGFIRPSQNLGHAQKSTQPGERLPQITAVIECADAVHTIAYGVADLEPSKRDETDVVRISVRPLHGAAHDLALLQALLNGHRHRDHDIGIQGCRFEA